MVQQAGKQQGVSVSIDVEKVEGRKLAFPVSPASIATGAADGDPGK